MYFETKYPLQLQYFLRPTEVPFYQIIIIFIVIIDILKKIYDLMNCCNTLSSAQIPHSTAWTKLKKTIVWKSLWGSGSGYIFFHASLPPSPGALTMSNAMQSQTRIERRNVINFNLISPCIANRWVWMMERVGRRRGFWKGERESANKFLCKIPNFAFDCPDQCGIRKQFAFVKNIFANKYILLQINIATIRIIFVS